MNTCPECALGNHDACTSDLAPCDCAGSPETDWIGDHVRGLAKSLLPTAALADEHCHAVVVDKDGEQDACGKRAEHWTIYDPDCGDQRAWPVCYYHADTYPRADAWVEAVSVIPYLLDRVAAEATP